MITSCLDAVVAGINALCAMVNQCYAAFKLMPWIKYTRYANFANDIGKAIIFHVMAFIRSESDLLAVSYSNKYFGFVANASEN